MGGIIIEYVDHVIEVNERVIDGDSNHFVKVKSSHGDQAPSRAKSTFSDPQHHVQEHDWHCSQRCGYLSNEEVQSTWSI